MTLAARCLAALRIQRIAIGHCVDCGSSFHLGACRLWLSYWDRKSCGLCTYAGCARACTDVSVQCEAHRLAAKERVRLHRERFVTAILPLAA